MKKKDKLNKREVAALVSISRDLMWRWLDDALYSLPWRASVDLRRSIPAPLAGVLVQKGYAFVHVNVNEHLRLTGKGKGCLAKLKLL